ncbi:MAG: hypothetical protein ACL93V_03830 [Candidatus Electrothrix sp. YB6]
MKSLFHPNFLSSRFSKSNSPAVRGNIQLFFGLLPDVVLFYSILAVDAALTAEMFLRDLSGTEETAPAAG